MAGVALKGARMILAAWLLSACSDPVPPLGLDLPRDIFFPTHHADGPQPAALFEGRLEVEDGCVYLADHGDRWLGLWPAGLQAELYGDRLRILDEWGRVLAIEGGPIRAGGGERRPSEMGGEQAFNEWIQGFVGVQIPERCGKLVWQVSGIELT